MKAVSNQPPQRLSTRKLWTKLINFLHQAMHLKVNQQAKQHIPARRKGCKNRNGRSTGSDAQMVLWHTSGALKLPFLYLWHVRICTVYPTTLGSHFTYNSPYCTFVLLIKVNRGQTDWCQLGFFPLSLPMRDCAGWHTVDVQPSDELWGIWVVKLYTFSSSSLPFWNMSAGVFHFIPSLGVKVF